MIFRTFSAPFNNSGGPGATRFALLSACPWLSYSAPLALRSVYLIGAAVRLSHRRCDLSISSALRCAYLFGAAVRLSHRRCDLSISSALRCAYLVGAAVRLSHRRCDLSISSALRFAHLVGCDSPVSAGPLLDIRNTHCYVLCVCRRLWF